MGVCLTDKTAKICLKSNVSDPATITPFLSPTVAVGNVGCVPREAGRANMDS